MGVLNTTGRPPEHRGGDGGAAGGAGRGGARAAGGASQEPWAAVRIKKPGQSGKKTF